MVTESFQEYKGFIIRLRAVTNNGFWYSIIKTMKNESSPDGVKNCYLSKKGFNFIAPLDLLSRAKKHINNHEGDLNAKYQQYLLKQI